MDSFSILPREILAEVLMPFLDSSSTFVLSFVCRRFRALLSDFFILKSPTEDYCHRGYLNLLTWDQTGPSPSTLGQKHLLLAINGRQEEIIRFLLQAKVERAESCLDNAASTGSVSIVKIFQSFGFEVTLKNIVPLVTQTESSVFSPRPKGRFFPLFRYLIEDCGCKPDESDIIKAAKFGEKDAVAYLLEKVGIIPKNLFRALCQQGNRELVEWGESIGATVDLDSKSRYQDRFMMGFVSPAILDLFVERGIWPLEEASYEIDALSTAIPDSLENFEWIMDHLHYLPKNAFSELSAEEFLDLMGPAAKKFGVRPFRLAVERGLELQPVWYALAYEGNHIDAITYLDSLDCPIDDESLVSAVRAKNFDAVPKLLERGLKWTLEASAAVAKTGDVSYFRKIVKVGYPFNSSALSAAIKANQLKMVRYLIEELQLEATSSDVIDAIREANLPILKYLCDRKVSFHYDFAFYVATQSPRRRIFDLILQAGLQLKPSLAENAAGNDSLLALKWLVSVGCEIDWANVKEANLRSHLRKQSRCAAYIDEKIAVSCQSHTES